MVWRASVELRSGRDPVCTPYNNQLERQNMVPSLPSLYPTAGLGVTTQIGNSCKSYPTDALILCMIHSIEYAYSCFAELHDD